MARARNLKPGFFTNEKLAECAPLARLLFQGLWCHADREGRLEDRPKRLKAEILPYDDCDASALLDQLQTHGFIARYEADGIKVIQILSFAKHQNPHPKEPASQLPAMESRDKPRQEMESRGNSCPVPENPERAGPLPSSPIPLPSSSVPPSEGAEAAPLEARVYQLGREVLGKNSGGQVTKLRKALRMDDRLALDLLERARTKGNRGEWIAGVIRNRGRPPPELDELGLPKTPLSELGKETDELYRKMGIDF